MPVSRDAALARLFDTLRQGLYLGTLDESGSATLAANRHLKLTFGYPEETADADVRPFDADRFVDAGARQALLDRLTHDGSASDVLLRLRRADGSAFWAEVTVDAQPGPAGLHVGALVRDVTERKKLDDQARDLQQQLLQAEKLASLGQTVSGVAHELNNPLATILTSAERLAQQPATPALRRGLETILGEAERAARIVRSLLTFSRKRHSTRTLVDLNQVVRDTLALRVYEQRLSDITTLDALASGLPPVFADPHQLQQVLLNLIINAEQAMISTHGRGVLVLRSWHDAERDLVLLEINDDGPGVPQEAMAKIFDPFFTTKAVGQGTGLGLTVVYAILQEHGGHISASSTPGRGASFVIELPTSSGVAVPKRRPEPVGTDFGGGAAVLLVDDERALADAVAAGLRDAGFVVEQAGDGEEALALVGAQRFELVICDLRMPRLDGPSFYRAMVASTPSLARRVIFVTGDVAGTDAERFLAESGCRWLPKPFRLADLLRLAREVLG